MADDLVINVELNAVVAAIEALRGRGVDVNPFSLAEELNVSIGEVLNSAEIMQLVSAPGQDAAGVSAAEYNQLLAKVKELENRNARLQGDVGESDLEDELRLLQARIDEESARTRRWEEEARLLKNRNAALLNELRSLKSYKNSTVEISRPQDDLNGLFSSALPASGEFVELRQESETLRARCRELESELVAKSSLCHQEGIDEELDRLRHENKELNEFKNSALSEEEQEALSQHLALLTARQSELSMLIEHLQKENGKLAADSQSVLSSEELHVLRDHIEALTAQNAELSLQAQQYTNEHAELAARHNDYVGQHQELAEQFQDLQVKYQALQQAESPAAGEVSAQLSARIVQLEKDKAKLTEQVGALESANQIIAGSIQDAWQQGYESAKLDFARENFAQMAANAAAAAEAAEAAEAERNHQATSSASMPSFSDSAAEAYPLPDYLSQSLFDESEQAVVADAIPSQLQSTEPPIFAAERPDIDFGSADDWLPTPEQRMFEQERQQSGSEDGLPYNGQAGAQLGTPLAGVDLNYADAPAAVGNGFASDPGYSPFAKVDPAEFGIVEPPADEQEAKKYDAEQLRDLVQHRRQDHEAPAESQKNPALKKFVGSGRITQEVQLPTMPRNVPPDIRKACLLLGVKPEDLTRANVFNAWKREMAKPGVHPDTGGDTEMATYLNTAKDRLIRFLEETEPKLGKKFGSKEHPGTKESPKPKK